MVRAISTSSSALSNGTRPISLRYVWTGPRRCHRTPPKTGALPAGLATTACRRTPLVVRPSGLDSSTPGAATTTGSSSSSSFDEHDTGRGDASMRVVSTSGVSSTACSVSMTSSWVSCPFSRPKASTASKSTCETPAGNATCAIGARTSGSPAGDAGLASIPSSSIAIAESSFTGVLPKSSLLYIPSGQPRYQPVGTVAPGGRIIELVQPEPHLHRLRGSGLPCISTGA